MNDRFSTNGTPPPSDHNPLPSLLGTVAEYLRAQDRQRAERELKVAIDRDRALREELARQEARVPGLVQEALEDYFGRLSDRLADYERRAAQQRAAAVNEVTIERDAEGLVVKILDPARGVQQVVRRDKDGLVVKIIETALPQPAETKPPAAAPAAPAAAPPPAAELKSTLSPKAGTKAEAPPESKLNRQQRRPNGRGAA